MLVVNAPKIFKPTWKVFKHLMPKKFTKKICFVKDSSALQEYLMEGYERHLPIELNGWGYSRETVEDFIDLQRHEERILHTRKSVSDSEAFAERIFEGWSD